MAQFPVRVCSWEDISFSESEQLLELCRDTECLQSQLASRLGVLAGKSDKQPLIELDLFTYAVLFCKKNEFSPEQLSAFFTILKSVHSMCISRPYDNLQDTFVYFRELLLRHSVHRPPFSTSLYTLVQVKAITDYVLSTYFKHFKLYKYAFTKRVQLNLHFTYNGEPGTGRRREAEGEGERKGEGEGEGEGTVARMESPVHVDTGEEEKEADQEGGTMGEEEGEGEGGESNKEELSPELQRLRHIITSALNTRLKQLKVSVEQQMNEHEKKMAEKLSQLEVSSDPMPKRK